MMQPFEEQIVDNAALSEEERVAYERYQARLPDVRETLLAARSSRELPVLALPDEPEQLEEINAVAKQIREHSAGLIVLGTGGSSLGGKTLCAMAEADDDFELHFVENLDPHSMDKLLAHPKLRQMHLLIISKSGATMETLTQAMVLLQAMGKGKAHAITMPGDSPLTQLAKTYQLPTLAHDPKVGGRFSVLSNVALLPAAVMGVDVAAILQGASSVMAQLEASANGESLKGAAWQAACMPTRPVSVLMPYCDRLRLLGDWYRQLWAESLGKGGIGSTPATALGAVDQHSQLQLYLDGPKDKLFTLVSFDYSGQGARIEQPAEGFGYLAGKSIGDAMVALQHGTIETLSRHHLPLRVLKAGQPDAATLGALLMHFMLETMATAQLLGVNAFDQPAVEESKQLARAALGAT